MLCGTCRGLAGVKRPPTGGGGGDTSCRKHHCRGRLIFPAKLSTESDLFLDQPLEMNPTGQHGREEGQHVLLHFADGRGQGADDSIEAHLLDDVLEGRGRLACDSAQGLRNSGVDPSQTLRVLGTPPYRHHTPLLNREDTNHAALSLILEP